MMHHVAVYGSLKKGFGNHRLLRHSTYLGEEWVEGWTMYHLGGFPAVAETENYDVVKVEVYLVDDETLGRLDGLEGYPHFYNRKEIETNWGDAWIYFHDVAPTAPIVAGGDW